MTWIAPPVGSHVPGAPENGLTWVTESWVDADGRGGAIMYHKK
jgi:hypothetical protein